MSSRASSTSKISISVNGTAWTSDGVSLLAQPHTGMHLRVHERLW